jgi:uncharacterized membrane protein
MYVQKRQRAIARVGIPTLWQDFKWILGGSAVLLLLMIAGESFWFLRLAQVPLGLVYVLFVPGYCLAAALFPQQGDIDGVERIGISIGLSIAVVPLLALLLNSLPWGIRPWPILWAEYGASALFMAIALWRRSRLSIQVVDAPALAWQPRVWWRGLSALEKRIYMLIAGFSLLATLAAIWAFMIPAPNEFVTEFYILGKGGVAQDYPRQSMLGEQLSVTIGVKNREQEQHGYRIEVWAVDPWNAERRALLTKDGPITLAPGQQREWPISWQMPWSGNNQQVEFLLFAGDRAEPYRQLRLWLNVAGGGSTS